MSAYGSCPVVRVAADNAQGFVIINESDFDPTRHTLAIVPPPPLPVVVTPPPPAPPDPLGDLPKDWRNGEPASLRRLCEQVTGRTPEDRRQAVEMIEAALLARK